GVTAEFNLNMLRHLNRELGANFNLDGFVHQAHYDAEYGRIEMHLISKYYQIVTIDGTNIQFKQDETIWTESSYKYSLPEFEALANQAGFRLEKAWVDDNNLFSVQYFV
ncbi:MAG: L-histidine N(alpha)-methyltransferase, partial [Chloroflexota bacterium]